MLCAALAGAGLLLDVEPHSMADAVIGLLSPRFHSRAAAAQRLTLLRIDLLVGAGLGMLGTALWWWRARSRSRSPSRGRPILGARGWVLVIVVSLGLAGGFLTTVDSLLTWQRLWVYRFSDAADVELRDDLFDGVYRFAAACRRQIPEDARVSVNAGPKTWVLNYLLAPRRLYLHAQERGLETEWAVCYDGPGSPRNAIRRLHPESP